MQKRGRDMGSKKDSSSKSGYKRPKKIKKDKSICTSQDSLALEDMELDNGSDVLQEGNAQLSQNTTKKHKKQLERLQEKDPEFYQFLKEHDKELLDFDDEDMDDEIEDAEINDESLDQDFDEDVEAEYDDTKSKAAKKKGQEEQRKTITTKMVDQWCMDIKENGKLGAIRSLLRAFRVACHYGDDEQDESGQDFSIVSSSVFNKIMLFVLSEMDGVLRGLLKFQSSGGKKETVMDLTTTRAWKNYGNLMRLYLGNALHVLNQMTDEQMASFTLKRIKASAVFLAAFPTLLRKYVKVALHFWGIGGGALQVVSFLFLRDLCVRLGTDCLDTCLKGIYKAYVMNCKIKGKYVSASKLQHLRFLENCVAELYGVDLPSAYQHAFTCIRQLATILRNAFSEKPKKGKKKEVDGGKKKQDKGRKKGQEENIKKTKEAYLKVYDWQFINCLELWTTVICAYSSDTDFRHLAYPLAQIILGVARLVPTARYLPVRIQCARMLNRIGAATGNFIPISSLMLDVLEMKELTNLPIGGMGKGVDFFTRKLVGKPTLKTRAFQEACIFSVVEQLSEHLAQSSYSIAFFELSFIPNIRLRSFCKTSKVDMFRKEIKELIRQIEVNGEFTNAKRADITFSPRDPNVDDFLKVEKESGTSPLSQFASELKLRANQRRSSMVESSVLVGAKSSIFSKNLQSDGEEEEEKNELDSKEGADVFSSSWLPDAKAGLSKSKRPKQQKPQKDKEIQGGEDEDVVEDLVLSSDDDEDPASSVTFSEDEEEQEEQVDRKNLEGESKKRKKASGPPQKTRWTRNKKSKRSKKRADS